MTFGILLFADGINTQNKAHIHPLLQADQPHHLYNWQTINQNNGAWVGN
jgi:hypothetical protein